MPTARGDAAAARLKREWVIPGGTAIASLNCHQRFFADRFEIRRDGEMAFSGCLAFGLERWLLALRQPIRHVGELLTATGGFAMGCVVVTGAGGYLGGLLTRRWLAENIEPTLWLHARDANELRRKRRDLPPALARLPITGGDLIGDEPFAGLDASAVEVIVHAAAVTRFNVEAGEAEDVNVVGTRKLLEFAARCPNLDRVVLVSTLYVAGLEPATYRSSHWAGRLPLQTTTKVRSGRPNNC